MSRKKSRESGESIESIESKGSGVSDSESDSLELNRLAGLDRLNRLA